LAAEVFKFITSGLSVQEPVRVICKSDKQYLKLALDSKLKGEYSDKYKSMLGFVYDGFVSHLTDENITSNNVKSYLNHYYALGVSYNTIKRHLSVLINEARNIGMNSNPMESIKAKKTKAKLHKPYKDIRLILDEIKLFNDNLYLCCIMTYGCLLRPHREIRELTWGDFSDDLKYIHLSGNRNKSGKNRIVPVPIYIRQLLVKGQPQHNIFTGTTRPLNEDYFKTLWGRFKRVSKLLEQDQTLYSFRHSGAIEIFKRTGSITKLQKAMGHSSINVSLTYLRGLEIAELKEEDMPMV
ncbi:MAG: site-specific integrase, partial [Flavobacteriaceae bacterium]